MAVCGAYCGWGRPASVRIGATSALASGSPYGLRTGSDQIRVIGPSVLVRVLKRHRRARGVGVSRSLAYTSVPGSVLRIIRRECRTSLSANRGCWHAPPMSVSATLTLAPGCSPWRLRPALGGTRLPSRTVAAGPTCGAQVAADLRGCWLEAGHDAGRAIVVLSRRRVLVRPARPPAAPPWDGNRPGYRVAYRRGLGRAGDRRPRRRRRADHRADQVHPPSRTARPDAEQRSGQHPHRAAGG